MKRFILLPTLWVFSVIPILLVWDGCVFCVCACVCVYVCVHMHMFTYECDVCLRLTYSSLFHSAYHSCDHNFFSWDVQNHSINHKHYFTERPHEHNCSWIAGRKQGDESTSSSFYNQNSSCNKYFSPAREILRSIRREGDKVASDTKGNDGWTTVSQGNQRYFLSNIDTVYTIKTLSRFWITLKWFYLRKEIFIIANLIVTLVI